MKFRPSTAEHDFQVRKNQIIRFLGEGFKVKAMIFHRGREMAHQDVGRAKMDRLLKEIMEHAQVEFGPRMEANILLALLAPKKGAAAPRAGAVRRRHSAGRPERRQFRSDPKGRRSAASRRGTTREEEQENEVEDAPRRRQALQDDFDRKVMRWHSGKRHLLGTKSPRRQRKLAGKVEVNPADVPNSVCAHCLTASSFCVSIFPRQAARNPPRRACRPERAAVFGLRCS